MKIIKFYLTQFGKSCGYVNCTNKGYFLIPTREGMTKYRLTFWVTCGHKHKVAN